MDLRFVVYSDIHHSVERLDDTIKVERQITDYCVKNGINLVVFLGDRFKLRNPPGWLEDVVDREWVERLNKGIKVISLIGQHDQYDKSMINNSYDSFEVFGKTGNDSLFVIRDYSVIQIGKFIFHGVSYGGVDRFLEVIKDKKFLEGYFYVFLMHGMIEGAKVSDEADFVTSGVSKAYLENFDLVLCGDIHLPQRLDFNKVVGGYVGSVLQLTKADIGSERGFLDVKCFVDENNKKDIKWEFIKSDAPEFVEVNFDDIKNVRDYKNCFVYVKLDELDDKKEKVIMELKKVAKQVFIVQEKKSKIDLKPVIGKSMYEEIDLYLNNIDVSIDKQKLKEYIFEKVKEL